MKCPVCNKDHRSIMAATSCSVAINNHLSFLKVNNMPITKTDIKNAIRCEYIIKSLSAQETLYL